MQALVRPPERSRVLKLVHPSYEQPTASSRLGSKSRRWNIKALQRQQRCSIRRLDTPGQKRSRIKNQDGCSSLPLLRILSARTIYGGEDELLVLVLFAARRIVSAAALGRMLLAMQGQAGASGSIGSSTAAYQIETWQPAAGPTSKGACETCCGASSCGEVLAASRVFSSRKQGRLKATLGSGTWP